MALGYLRKDPEANPIIWREGGREGILKKVYAQFSPLLI